MRLAICDDAIDELSRIATLLEKYRSARGIPVTYETFCSATELLETMQQRQFDLLFLDIIMPGLTGMEAAEEIRLSNEQIPIIFLTSSREFAVESYRVSAENYILKPAQEEEIFLALDKLLAKLSQEETYLMLKTSGSIVRLPVSEIVYVEVMNRKLQFALTSGEIKDAYGYLADYEKDLLASTNFVKPHRSYMVNLGHVAVLNKSGFTTVTGKIVPVAKESFTKIKAAYMKYLLTGKAEE